MKRLLIIAIIAFISFAARAQDVELLGSYYTSSPWPETINFKGVDSFYFSRHNGAHPFKGKGRCEIRDDRLYLYFENRKTQDEIKHEITRRITSDSIKHLNISCIYLPGTPLGNESVFIHSGKRIIQQDVCDSLGNIQFAILEKDFPIIIRVAAVGMLPIDIDLKDAADYSLKLFHGESWGVTIEINKGEVFVYEIRELSPDFILMRRPVGEGQFYKYKKFKN
jgi:hypothetical protein